MSRPSLRIGARRPSFSASGRPKLIEVGMLSPIDVWSLTSAISVQIAALYRYASDNAMPCIEALRLRLAFHDLSMVCATLTNHPSQ
jgi:hypothetical protein